MNGGDARKRLDHIELGIQRIVVVDALLGRLLQRLRLQLCGIKVPKRMAAHDLEQPGSGHAGVAQLVAKAPGAGEAVLHHIFGNRTRAGQRPGAAQQKSVMLAHPLVVARLGGGDHVAKERACAAFIPCLRKYFVAWLLISYQIGL